MHFCLKSPVSTVTLQNTCGLKMISYLKYVSHSTQNRLGIHDDVFYYLTKSKNIITMKIGSSSYFCEDGCQSSW